jgi:hypothetical protein|tara:strand:- start:866 stop:1051 length:186 start_codon:yes stop_codon:yes gene_type:complete
MKKSIIKLALDALELRLMQDRQDAKRNGNFADYDTINNYMDIVREYQKELQTEEPISITLV